MGPGTGALAADGPRSRPYEYRSALSLADELGVSLPVATTLVRRGFEDPASAREFLGGGEVLDLEHFPGLREAAGSLLKSMDRGRRITVYGDFDVDGVCATTVLVEALRELGADCDWMIPDRMTEGYGLNPGAVERLIDRGTGHLVTVDNGIASQAEVSLALERGLDVLVTDHHRAPPDLPQCPTLHPVLSGYEGGEICGAAVAWKLACELRRASGVNQGMDPTGMPGIDLVALASVADLVPLTLENRALVRNGLAVLRRAARPGIRALAASSGCELSDLDEGDLGFRFGPRINAAGRLYRADAGVELLLSSDTERCAQIASELEEVNRERRRIELEVRSEAMRQAAEQRDQSDSLPAIVVAAKGWHPGVVGIVASRLVEEFNLPSIVISLDGDGTGRGSGRSVPGLDLVEALGRCSRELRGFGGHRAAAGLQIDEDHLEAFRKAFSRTVLEALGPGPAETPVRVDATVAGLDLGLPLAEELEAFRPCGIGNPGPTLLVPAAVVTDQRTVGDDGAHLRFTLASGGYRAAGIAFGRSSRIVPDGERAHLAVRLEKNHWNGAVESRVRLIEAWPQQADQDAEYVPEIADEEWWRRFESWLVTDPPAGLADSAAPTVRDHRPGSAVALLVELLSAGENVIATCSDAGRRARLCEQVGGLQVLESPHRALAISDRDSFERRVEPDESGRRWLLLVDFAAWSLSPRCLAPSPRHVVALDPPASAEEDRWLRSLVPDGGVLHCVWGPGEREFAFKVVSGRWDTERQLRELFSTLLGRGPIGGGELRSVLAGQGSLPRSPEHCASLVRVLEELRLVAFDPDPGIRSLRVVSSDKTELSSSPTYRRLQQRLESSRSYLQNR